MKCSRCKQYEVVEGYKSCQRCLTDRRNWDQTGYLRKKRARLKQQLIQQKIDEENRKQDEKIQRVERITEWLKQHGNGINLEALKNKDNEINELRNRIDDHEELIDNLYEENKTIKNKIKKTNEAINLIADAVEERVKELQDTDQKIGKVLKHIVDKLDELEADIDNRPINIYANQERRQQTGRGAVDDCCLKF